MRAAVWSCICGLLAVLGGCGAGSSDDMAAAPARSTEPRGPDLRRGEVLSFACQACHTLKAGEPHNIGPNLYGIFGKRAAYASNFAYSDALLAADFTWSADRLDQWLAAPETFLPGNAMPFAGYAKADDRRDLLAFLEIATASAPD
jgi:cytochrome c